ncbi:hypothetical protein D9613_012484 [Agrocybe pediades]|uniref:Fork-head domain-containing protein n=1 Tax=Agrocybe pediades TaxID=84607 RepID=A0A8H4QSN9_9AGAR|nr:hypothetical protein D9613_012484 [Agrocybe pediades]
MPAQRSSKKNTPSTSKVRASGGGKRKKDLPNDKTAAEEEAEQLEELRDYEWDYRTLERGEDWASSGKYCLSKAAGPLSLKCLPDILPEHPGWPTIIRLAIWESPRKMLKSRHICRAVQRRWPDVKDTHPEFANTIRHNLTYNEISRKLKPNGNSKRRSIGDAWVLDIRLHGTKPRKTRSKATTGSSGALETHVSQLQEYPAVEHDVQPSESISPSMALEDALPLSPTFYPLAVLTLDEILNSSANLQSPWKKLPAENTACIDIGGIHGFVDKRMELNSSHGTIIDSVYASDEQMISDWIDPTMLL